MNVQKFSTLRVNCLSFFHSIKFSGLKRQHEHSVEKISIMSCTDTCKPDVMLMSFDKEGTFHLVGLSIRPSIHSLMYSQVRTYIK